MIASSGNTAMSHPAASHSSYAATIRAAADAAVEETDPLSDLMGSAEYRRQMVRVWVRRLLTSLAAG